MFALLKQRRLHWLGHVSSIEDGRIPKDMPYGELATRIIIIIIIIITLI